MGGLKENVLDPDLNKLVGTRLYLGRLGLLIFLVLLVAFVLFFFFLVLGRLGLLVRAFALRFALGGIGAVCGCQLGNGFGSLFGFLFGRALVI